MEKRKMMFIMLGLVAIAMFAVDAQAFRVTTEDGGADVELREENGTTNRGDNNELASRVGSAYGGKDSSIYLKFDVSSISAADLAGDITVRTTYGNPNLEIGRIQNTAGDFTGFDYFVMTPGTTGEDWGEMTITPETAPAYYYDGAYQTKAQYSYDPLDGSKTLNPNLTYLGTNLFDSADLVGGHLPVGGAFDLTLSAGSALHQAIAAAQASAYEYVTVVMGVTHDWDNEYPNWVGFNYIFNSKEVVNWMKDDPTSPWYTLDNSNDDFSPMLTNEPHIAPEPATMVLLGLGGLILRRKRK